MSMVYVLVWPSFVTSGAEGSMDPLPGKRGRGEKRREIGLKAKLRRKVNKIGMQGNTIQLEVWLINQIK